MEQELEDIKHEITVLKGEIEESKAALHKLEGRREEILSTLKTTYGITSIQKAERKLASLTKKRESLQKVLVGKYEELQQEMELVDQGE